MTNPRACFTPCFCKKLFYLVGGQQTNSMESFSPDTEKFTQLALALPQVGQCVCFFDGGELVVLQGTSVYKNKLHENEASFRVSTCATNFNAVMVPPVKYQSSVFLINNSNIIKFDVAKLIHQDFA